MESARSYRPPGPGPFRVEDLRPGVDRYELSDGHPVIKQPGGRRHAELNRAAGELIGSDPAVEAAGVDPGYVLGERTMRAPDVAVGNLSGEPGFARGAPTLAVEFVEGRRDERDLAIKIAELLAAGTRLVWVVRLSGPRRVEVRRPGEPMTLVRSGDELSAPGILRNPVPVDALYDRELAHELTLRNLLQRRGYENLDAVRGEVDAAGRQQGAIEHARALLLREIARRTLSIDDEQRAAIERCAEVDLLDAWLEHVLAGGDVTSALRRTR